MSNLFDQYREASTRGPAGMGRLPAEPPVSGGYIDVSLQEEKPIFTKQKVNYVPPDPISHLCVCSDYLALAMGSNKILRIDLNNPEITLLVDLPQAPDDRVYKMFMDPSGKHLIISMISGENYYIARNVKKARVLGKFKGHQVSAVGWNAFATTDNGTGPILIGTSKGQIFETDLQTTEDGRFFSATLEQYFKSMFVLNRDKVYPVTGLELQKILSTLATSSRYFILATTATRLFQFIGYVPTNADAPLFGHIFSKYESAPAKFLELPGHINHSELKLFYPKYRGVPTMFAWMVGPGIYCGKIDPTGAAGQDSVTTDTKLIPYPWNENETPSTPLAMALTEFHILITFPDRLKAMSVINDQVIYEDMFSERSGRVISMCRDPVSNRVWTFTSAAVYKYKVDREERDAWQLYLQQGNFERAKHFAIDNPAHTDKVLSGEADSLFEQGRYMESAKVYGLTQKPFEDVTIRFNKLKDKQPVKAFLLMKVDQMQSSEKTQLTMIVTWMIEIYLNELGRLKEEGKDVTKPYESLQEEFRQFLNKAKVKECANQNRNMVYDLIASHGDTEDMVFFAVLMQDHDRVISHHLQYDNYVSALDVLSKQQNIDLFYKFSPILMQNIPHETVDVWIAKRERLEPKKLIPALVQYDPNERNRKQGNEAIRYLEFCVQMLNIRDEAIHNYLLSLYCKLQPDSLIKYLNFQGQDPDQVCYDLKYALRLCCEYKQDRACVHIYSTMGLFEEAVDLALLVDIDLAKQNADKPEDDEELRKKLWLKIARHVVEKEKDIKQAMEFVIVNCELLKIEDILPFFPDFVTIDSFKDAICQSLEEYNQHITSLEEEMSEATESAQEIRADIHAFRNKFTFVRAQEKCSACYFPLMTRAFYLFPCMHKFHSDCLISNALRHLSPAGRARVVELQRKLASEERTSPVKVAPGSLVNKEPSAKEKLDDLVAESCIYCGEMMIKNIDQPFVANEMADDSSWL